MWPATIFEKNIKKRNQELTCSAQGGEAKRVTHEVVKSAVKKIKKISTKGNNLPSRKTL